MSATHAEARAAALENRASDSEVRAILQCEEWNAEMPVGSWVQITIVAQTLTPAKVAYGRAHLKVVGIDWCIPLDDMEPVL